MARQTVHKTASGIEATFAVNHLGHAALFHFLVPHLAPNARVIVVSSGTHDPAQKTGLPDAASNTAEDLAYPPVEMAAVPGRQRYSSSKLANVLWTFALHRRLMERVPDRGITVNAFDPGLMPGTGLPRAGSGIELFLWIRVLPRILPLLRLLFLPNVHSSAESGANLAGVATGKDGEGVSGKYIEVEEKIKERKTSKDSYDVGKQDDLWEWTTRYLGGGDEGEVKRLEEFR